MFTHTTIVGYSRQSWELARQVGYIKDMSTTLPLLLDRCVSVYVVVCAFRLLGPGPSVCVCMRA